MMDNNEEEYLMISGIQHFQFCKRQWALIHIEQQWEENVRTLEGQHIHKKVDQPAIKEKRSDRLIVRALPIKSSTLGVTGVCDVVEFVENELGVSIQGTKKKYIPVPVEYKRGKPKKDDADILQLTAQAMCLEEMLVCKVEKGYLYYNEIRRRTEIKFTDSLKNKVKDIFMEMHHYFTKKHTPKVKTGSFCNNCSLKNICVPRLMKKESVSRYIERNLKE
ncbi:CRISPR-associated protein Cas4 [Melghiribacillus thermohalophilus]|nr:CRISPR-associated protein Cas4 [Melghiribacillus thermohalophilus]